MYLNLSLTLIKSLTMINLFLSYNEYLALTKLFTNTGIFTENTLSKDFNNSFLGKYTSWLSQFNIIRSLLYLAFIFIIFASYYPHPSIFLFFILINLFFSFKTEGAFNGGSDYMTMLTLITLFLSYLFPNNNAFILYLALQLILSYFLAGVVKLKSESWRKGTAISDLFSGPNYSPPEYIKNIAIIPKISFILSWSVILIELLFPLLFFTKNVWIIFILGVIFHFFNFLCFGLNRFFWSWLAAYPSAFYLLKTINL